jgi:hypothetical protein
MRALPSGVLGPVDRPSCKNGTFYFSRQVPLDLQTRFNKNRVVVS